MNIINKGLVKLVMLPAPFYRKMGVNPPDLEVILKTKLLMDDRRPNSIHVTRPQKAGKQISLATVGTMAISALIGAFFLLSFRIGANLTTQITLYFTLYLTMLTLTLITDFTSVLVDVRDNQIILPKPVSSKTFTLSRILHIFIHINKIILPMSVSGLVYMGINHGIWASVCLLLAVFLVGMFSILIINMVYLLILRFTSPERFKTIISYVQIAMTVLIYGASQILPRMVDATQRIALDLEAKSWRWAWPPYWFARGWQFLTTFQINVGNIAGGILLLAVPILSYWIVIRFLAPSFTRKLAAMNTSEEVSAAVVKKGSSSFWNSLSERLASIMTSHPEERAAFTLVWKLTGRLRDFKLKVYPAAGYLVVITGIMVYSSFKRSESTTLQAFLTTGFVLGLTYASGLLLLTALGQLSFSENFKASWFYLIAPIQRPGRIFSGAIKAAVAKFYLPVMLIVSVLVIILVGWKALPNLILGFSNVILSCLIISLITFRYLPFSAQQSSSQQTGMMIRTLGSMLIAGVIGFLHFLVSGFIVVVCIGAVLSIIACWLVLGSVSKRSWPSIKAAYEF